MQDTIHSPEEFYREVRENPGECADLCLTYVGLGDMPSEKEEIKEIVENVEPEYFRIMQEVEGGISISELEDSELYDYAGGEMLRQMDEEGVVNMNDRGDVLSLSYAGKEILEYSKKHVAN